MEQNLRGLFAQALDDEPEPAGDLARQAMAHGTRLRRRRGLLTGGAATGVVAVLATMVALNVAAQAPDTEIALGAALRMPAGPSCTGPTARTASEVAVFLTDDVTSSQRQAVDTLLRADPRVRSTTYESREQAYARFVKLWADEPDFVKSVTPKSLPESFRADLAQPSAYPSLAAAVKRLPGVQDVVGSTCSSSGERK